MTIEVTDKREMMANQLIMRGHATMLELLTASFGEWPPKGIEIDKSILHNQVVKLSAFDNDNLNGQASSTKKKDRFINMNQDLVASHQGVNSTLGHESIHILQGDNAFRKKDTFGAQMGFGAKMATSLFGQEEPTGDIIMSNILEHKDIGGLCNEFNDSVRGLDRNDWRAALKRINYLREGIEIQARIHQIIIDGYPNWKEVPASPDAFFAAMKRAGIQLPPEIEKRLAELPSNSPARKFLEGGAPKAKNVVKKVGEINKVTASFEKNGQQIFWNKIMPALYADLITMYGDKNGAKKMGFDGDLKKTVAQQVKTSLKSQAPA